MAGKCYLKRSLADVPVERDTCGSRQRLLTGADALPASLHVTRMTSAEPHVHRRTTEYYYVLDGSGRLTVEGEEVPLVPKDVVVIRPGARHSAKGELTVLVIAIPPFDPEDQFTAT